MKRVFILFILLLSQYILNGQYVYTGEFKCTQATFYENDVKKYISYDPVIFTVKINKNTNIGMVTLYKPEQGKTFKYNVNSLRKSEHDKAENILLASYNAKWNPETFVNDAKFIIHFYVAYNTGQIMIIIEHEKSNSASIYELSKL